MPVLTQEEVTRLGLDKASTDRQLSDQEVSQLFAPKAIEPKSFPAEVGTQLLAGGVDLAKIGVDVARMPGTIAPALSSDILNQASQALGKQQQEMAPTRTDLPSRIVAGGARMLPLAAPTIAATVLTGGIGPAAVATGIGMGAAFGASTYTTLFDDLRSTVQGQNPTWNKDQVDAKLAELKSDPKVQTAAGLAAGSQAGLMALSDILHAKLFGSAVNDLASQEIRTTLTKALAKAGVGWAQQAAVGVPTMGAMAAAQTAGEQAMGIPTGQTPLQSALSTIPAVVGSGAIMGAGQVALGRIMQATNAKATQETANLDPVLVKNPPVPEATDESVRSNNEQTKPDAGDIVLVRAGKTSADWAMAHVIETREDGSSLVQRFGSPTTRLVKPGGIKVYSGVVPYTVAQLRDKIASDPMIVQQAGSPEVAGQMADATLSLMANHATKLGKTLQQSMIDGALGNVFENGKMVGEGLMQTVPVSPYVSKLLTTIDNMKGERVGVSAFKNYIHNPQLGIKKDEFIWTSGFEDFLVANEGKTVTKQELRNVVLEGMVKLEDVEFPRVLPYVPHEIPEIPPDLMPFYEDLRKYTESRIDAETPIFDGGLIQMTFKEDSHSDTFLPQQRDRAIERNIARLARAEVNNTNLYEVTSRTNALQALAQVISSRNRIARFNNIQEGEKEGTHLGLSHDFLSNYREMILVIPTELVGTQWSGGHIQLENHVVLAHIAMGDVIDSQGKRSLHMIELQGDIYREARENQKNQAEKYAYSVVSQDPEVQAAYDKYSKSYHELEVEIRSSRTGAEIKSTVNEDEKNYNQVRTRRAEEITKQWMKDHPEAGYQRNILTSEERVQLAILDRQYSLLQDNFDRIAERNSKRLREVFHAYTQMIHPKLSWEDYSKSVWPERLQHFEEEKKAQQEINSAAENVDYKALQDKKRLEKMGPPLVPFGKTWEALGLRRMLQKATMEGYDSFSWSTGESQNHIQNWNFDPNTTDSNEQRKLNGAKAAYDGRYVDRGNDIAKKFGGKVGEERISKGKRRTTDSVLSVHPAQDGNWLVFQEGKGEIFRSKNPEEAVAFKKEADLLPEGYTLQKGDESANIHYRGLFYVTDPEGRIFVGDPLRTWVDGISEAYMKRRNFNEESIHSISITPAMLAALPNGIDLFQKNLESVVRGSLSQTPEGAFIIGLYKDHDLSTILEEVAHWMRLTQFTPEENKAFGKIYSVGEHDTIVYGTVKGFKLNRDAEEAFAKDFLQYLKEGVTPYESMKGIFAQFKSWLVDMWKNLRMQETPFTPEKRAFFDSLFIDQVETDSCPLMSDSIPIDGKAVLMQSVSTEKSDPNWLDKVDLWFSKRFGVERFFRMQGAENLGRAIHDMGGVAKYIQDTFVNEKRILAEEESKYTHPDAGGLAYITADDPAEWNALSPEQKQLLAPSHFTIQKVYAKALALMKEAGMVDASFYESKAREYQAKIVELQKAGNIELASNYEHWLNRFWDSKNDKPIAQFVSLPTWMFIDKILESGDTKLLNKRLRFLTQADRKNIFAKSLLDPKNGLGIELKDLKPLDIVNAYIDKLSKDISLAHIMKAAVEDGKAILVGDPADPDIRAAMDRRMKAEPGWVKPDSYAPAFRGYLIKPLLKNTLAEMTRYSESLVPFEKAFHIAKLYQFFQPIGLAFYKLYETSMLFGWKTIFTTTKYMRQAVRETLDQSENWRDAHIHGLSSAVMAESSSSTVANVELMRKGYLGNGALALAFKIYTLGGALPYKEGDAPSTPLWKSEEVGRFNTQMDQTLQGFKDARKSLQSGDFMGAFTKGSMTTLASPWHLIKGWYDASLQVAWGLEDLTRFAAFLHLKAQGHSSEVAAGIVPKFFGDYSDLPGRTRGQLGKVFFTPGYQISVAKLYERMIGAAGRQGVNMITGKETSAETKILAAGFYNTMFTTVALDLFIRSAFGFTAEEWGYKYKKKVQTAEGEKELIWTFPGPITFMTKYMYKLGRIMGDPGTSAADRLILETKWMIHPLLRVGIESARGVTFSGQEIHSEFDSPLEKFAKKSVYAITGIARVIPDLILRGYYGSTNQEVPAYVAQGLNDQQGREAFSKEVGKVMDIVASTFSFQSLRSPKEIRIAKQIRDLQDHLRQQTVKAVRDPRMLPTEMQLARYQLSVEKLLGELQTP